MDPHVFFDFPGLFAAGAPSGPGGGGLTMLLPILLMIVGFYFLIIAPQRKQEKKRQAMIAALKNGDEVLTNGGLYGTVANVKNDRITLKVNDTTRMDFAKNAIAQRIPREGEAEGEKNEKK